MGESRKAFAADSDVQLRTHIGGQALIEGIMMRGRYNWAVAVREPGGAIYTEEHDLASGRAKNSWMYWPVIRGCTAFVESLALGFKALGISSEHAYEWDEDEDGVDDGKKSGGMGALMTLSMIVGIVLGIVIFVVLPAALSNLVLGEASMNSVAWNIFDGIVRVAIFILYIWLISLMKDIRRMFSYHGAEHKTIACYEAGDPLTVENVRKYTRFHPRCGTSFLILVVIVSVFLYSVLPWGSIGLRGLFKLLLLPLVMGISYELLKWCGRSDNIATRIIRQPGIWVQHLTVFEPDDSMIEVAIAAVTPVLPETPEEGKW